MNERTDAAGQTLGERPKRAWIYLGIATIALSCFATAIVIGNVVAGIAPQRDENAWAHLFQLAITAQVPLLLLFFATADWKRKQRVITLFACQILAAAAAFGALAWSGY